MRRSFVLCAVIVTVYFGLVNVSPSRAQEDAEWYLGKPIRNIVFSGLRHTSAQELEGILNAYIGQNYTYELVEELQIRLFALGFFEMLIPDTVPSDVERTGTILRFTAVERSVISRITFTGNSRLRSGELLDVVTLKNGDRVDPRRIESEEQALIDKYLEKGYTQVTIRSDVQSNSGGEAVVTFHITEGEQVTVQEFRFDGIAAFSVRALRNQLSLKAKGPFSAGTFQESKLIEDRESILQYYRDRGYIDAVIRDVKREEVTDEKGNKSLILTFVIDEGERFTFGGITFTGNRIFSTEQLQRQVYSKVGEELRASRLEADLQRVADLYFESGYIFNSITREEQRANTEVTYHVDIVERGRAHIESIRILGNEKTKTEVILREIPLEPGDVFSKTKISDAMRNLYNLQYFSAIIPEMGQGSAENLMDLVFQVEEQLTTDIQFGLTFSGTADPDQFPISGLLRLNDRNFLGGGNSLGIELSGSPDTQNLSFTYNHRYVFGLPLSLGMDFSISHVQKLTPMDNTKPFFNGDETFAFPDGFTSYDEYANASTYPAEFLMRYNQWYFSLGFSSGYRWLTSLGVLSAGGGLRMGLILNSYNADLFRPFDPTIRRNNNKVTPSNSLWFSLSLDQRDIYYDPSNGYFASQRFGLYGVLPAELEKYIRSDTKAEYFHTLLNIPVSEQWSFKVIGGLHTGLSFIMPQPGQTSAIVERANQLAIDGMFIGRGWESEYTHKGLALWENWAELRIPVVPGILAWDFFFDIAGVSPSPKDFFTNFNPDSLRYSLGGGLRFTVPQFPLRFSFAKRFKTVDGVVQWETGSLGGKDSLFGGLDWVLSFVTSY
ncbi:MAG: outer membrane protein assembly factor BamA [Treponema sp.]|jgi:outer membrane protein insertion porin family|nr:outer membrane protein assembly factor BamA [Treponema sp.]